MLSVCPSVGLEAKLQGLFAVIVGVMCYFWQLCVMYRSAGVTVGWKHCDVTEKLVLNCCSCVCVYVYTFSSIFYFLVLVFSSLRLKYTHPGFLLRKQNTHTKTFVYTHRHSNTEACAPPTPHLLHVQTAGELKSHSLRFSPLTWIFQRTAGTEPRQADREKDEKDGGDILRESVEEITISCVLTLFTNQ